jgi:hypothetical protein
MFIDYTRSDRVMGSPCHDLTLKTPRKIMCEPKREKRKATPNSDNNDDG